MRKFFSASAFCAACSLLMPSMADAAPAKLQAAVISADDPSATKVGAYEFSSDAYGFTLLTQSYNLSATGGAILMPDNQFFALNIEDYTEWGMGYFHVGYIFDTTNWQVTHYGGLDAQPSAESTTTALDPASNAVYGCFRKSNTSTDWYFGTFNTNTLSSSSIASLSTPWLACDFDSNGTLYAIDRNGVLSTVATSNGAMTKVAETGIKADKLGSGAIDRGNDRFYVANGENLYCVDLRTKAVSTLYALKGHEQIVGMFVSKSGVEVAVPESVTDLTASLDNTQSTCTVSFTMPSAYSDGTALSGQISYTVLLDEVAVITKTATPGSKVSEAIAVSGAGKHTVSVTVSAGNVSGLPASAVFTIDGIPAGTVIPPYIQNFDDENAFNSMVSIDANSDNWHWIYWQQKAYSQFSGVSPADDYLLTPTLWLEAGSNYKFECDMWQRDAKDDETVEVVLGQEAVPAALKPIETYHLTDGSTKHVEIDFIPETTGIHHIGLHVVSPKNKYGIYADNFRVSAPVDNSAPGAQEISVMTDITGALNAEVTITPVFRTLKGSPADIDSIELFRDGNLVTTFTDIKQGTNLTFTDKVDAAGPYTWEVVAINKYGRGVATRTVTYIGINVPGPAENVVARETSTYGEVTLTWDHPSVDKDGYKFDSRFATYLLAYRLPTGALRIIADNVTGTSHTFTIKQPDEEQEFFTFIVMSKTSAGTNDFDVAASNKLSIGKPYEMPYAEKFGTDNPTYYTLSYNKSSVWRVYDYAPDQDGNKSFLYFDTYRTHSGSITTGKIAVRGNNPGFRFWFMCMAEGTEVIHVSVSEDGNDFTEISSVGIHEGNDQQWASYSVSLKDYIGKNLYIRLSMKSEGYRFGFDNFTLEEFGDTDIAAGGITVPYAATAGIDANIRVEVQNNSVTRSGECRVDLYREGSLLKSATVDGVPPFGSKWVTFIDNLNVFQSGLAYYAEVSSSEDTKPSNNRTSTTTLDVVPAPHPAPARLSALKKDGEVELSWKQPEFNLEPRAIVDGVDDYVTFSCGLPTSQLPNDNMGEWSTIDGDDSPCAIIQQGNSYAIYPNVNSCVGFIVFDVTKTGIEEKYQYRFSGRTSPQCFMALTSSVVPNDDWLISPALSGKAQKVSFYAKSAIDTYGLESFEFLVSKSGKNRSNFTTVASVKDVPTDWTAYSFDIPEGSTYFAIRYTANDVYAFLVDDISFEANGRDLNLDHKGYNLYRNRQFLTQITDGTLHTDRDFTEGDTYHATAVYATGESAPTDEAVPSAIEDIEAGNGMTVTATASTITVENPARVPVTITDATGRVIAIGNDSVITVEVTHGIYLVNAQGSTTKVAVN